MLLTPQEAVAKVTEKFNFSVNMKPLSWGDVGTPYFGLFRSDNLATVGSHSVTADYTPHTTEDVTALVESGANVFDGKIDVRCYFNNGHYVTMMPSKEHRRAIYGTEDNIFPVIMLRAGYCGSAFKQSLCFKRDLCQNMAELSTMHEMSFTIRHTSGLRDKMDMLKKRFLKLRESWDNLGDVIAKMQAQETNLKNFLETIYTVTGDDSKQTLKNHSDKLGLMFSRMQDERERSGRPTLAEGDHMVSIWEAFNAVQGYVQHDMTRADDSAWNRVLKAGNDPAVKAAEKLALELALAS